MPKNSEGSKRDPMAGEVDRLLRQLGTTQERAQRAGQRPPPRPGTLPGAPPPVTITLPSPTGVWVRAALGALLAGAMLLWPYRTCGLPLAGYFVSTAVVVVTGVWAAYASWRRRMGFAHVLSVAVIFSGIALATFQVLPRVGYAAMQAAWGCPG